MNSPRHSPLSVLGSNGWTGAQYSLFRAALGPYLAVHFVHLLPWAAEVFSSAGMLARGADSPLLSLFPNVLALADSPAVVRVAIAAGGVLALMLGLGWHDRPAALGLWYILACLFGRNPLTSNPSLPFVGWILLAHAAMPGAPYGSLAALGRADPGSQWRFPPAFFAAAWVVMAVAYTYSGFHKLASPSWLDGSALRRVLDNPLARPSFVRDALLTMPAWSLRLATWSALLLELLFLPLAVFRRTRPWIWGVMLAMHLSLIALIDFADLSMGMVMLHLFTFDPAWVRPVRANGTVLIFFDGSCVLCHRFVRFVASEDRAAAFRFSPLDGETCRRMIGPSGPDSDTMLVVTDDGALLTRSRAAAFVLSRLGGIWRVLGAVINRVPAPLADRVYNAIALRRRMLGTPPQACPLAPEHLRVRMLP